MSGHSPSMKALTITFALLLMLAALSFGLSYLPLGAWEMPLALIIGALKAALVLFVFMELHEAGFLPRFVVVAMIAWLCLLMTFMVLDVLTREGVELRAPAAAAATGSNEAELR